MAPTREKGTPQDRRLILAIDQSTSATKALLFDSRARLVNETTVEHKQYYPKPGWVEHDAEEIYANTVRVASDLVESLGEDRSLISALALTNQRETSLVWNRETGRPLYRAIVWQCERGAELCRRLKTEGQAARIKSKSGLLLDPYFSASKIAWVLDNLPGAAVEASKGNLAFGTIDSWLIYRLTGGKEHLTDYSNASRTLLLNLEAMDWDDDLLALFGIPRSMAPDLRSSNAFFGSTTIEGLLERPIPISGVLGDSHAALFAQGCYRPGEAKVTYGTGSSIMANIGRRPLDSGEKIVTSVGWRMGDLVDYVFEGNIHSTGDTIKWLADGLGLIAAPSESEALARSVSDNNGVYLVPAFAGLGAPYWDNAARASITGMARNTTKAHVVRAALESIAYQVSDLLEEMKAQGGIELSEVRADGGATRNDFLMQLQTDILGVPVTTTGIANASALGSALMAGIAVGIWKDLDELAGLDIPRARFVPKMADGERDRLLEGWHEAVRRTRSRPIA